MFSWWILRDPLPVFQGVMWILPVCDLWFSDVFLSPLTSSLDLLLAFTDVQCERAFVYVKDLLSPISTSSSLFSLLKCLAAIHKVFVNYGHCKKGLKDLFILSGFGRLIGLDECEWFRCMILVSCWVLLYLCTALWSILMVWKCFINKCWVHLMACFSCTLCSQNLQPICRHNGVFNRLLQRVCKWPKMSVSFGH